MSLAVEISSVKFQAQRSRDVPGWRNTDSLTRITARTLIIRGKENFSGFDS
jgi:hypothetical protein